MEPEVKRKRAVAKTLPIKTNDEEIRMIDAGAKHSGLGKGTLAKMLIREYCKKHKLVW